MRRLALSVTLMVFVAACSDSASTTTAASAASAVAPVVTTTTELPTAPTSMPISTTAAPPTTDTSPTAPSADPPGPAGASGLGDPYFPELGNGGYDVSHYDIDMVVDPETAELEATTTITALAEETLATFNLDFVGLEIASVMVDGAESAYVRDGAELRVFPEGGIVEGEEFTVTIEYSGRPQLITVSSLPFQVGWIQTPEGIFVVAVPDAARTWFPSNDHPTDKATFTFHVTVPKPLTAAANGALVATIDNGDTRTFMWDLESLMATYLATVVIGEYERVESRGPDGILIRDYLPTSFNGTVPPALEVTSEAMGFLAEWFGPYPFDRYGHVVVSDMGWANENQTLTLIGQPTLIDEFVVHELAHSWWGGSVTPQTWQHIWLNEGFATFAQFLWIEHTQGREAMLERIGALHEILVSQDLGGWWAPRINAIADPQESQLFGRAVYWRGGITLHALRVTVGDEVLKEIFREYSVRFAGSTASTEDFIAVAEEVSDQDLTELFDEWVYTGHPFPELPTG